MASSAGADIALASEIARALAAVRVALWLGLRIALFTILASGVGAVCNHAMLVASIGLVDTPLATGAKVLRICTHKIGTPTCAFGAWYKRFFTEFTVQAIRVLTVVRSTPGLTGIAYWTTTAFCRSINAIQLWRPLPLPVPVFIEKFIAFGVAFFTIWNFASLATVTKNRVARCHTAK